jgi:ribosome-associated protein
MKHSDIAYGGEQEPEYDENGDLIEYYAIRPNKTLIKKEIAEMAALAEELTQLTEVQLMAMGIPEKIEKALLGARKMPSTKPARKRQMKFVTARLREIDMDPILEQLNRIKTKSAHGVREHHQAETWRDKLVEDENNDVLTELLNQHPDADRQHLRQLQRNAQKEAKAEKPPKSARLLYQYVKDLVSDADTDDS